MNDELQQLKTVLQLLALPISGQMRLVGNDYAGIEVLVEAFDAAHRAIRTGAGDALIPEQAKTLTRLGDQLARLHRVSSSAHDSELAMRQSHDWRQVRMMAREVLVRWRWKLELPCTELLSSFIGHRVTVTA